MIGRVLSGRYAIEAVVGTGGMAVVYRAWDRVSQRTVAIKVLRPEYEQDEEFVRRFSREAEAAAKMSHENIINLLAVGKDGDMRYIVMEFVDGQTLKEMIREKGRIRSDVAVRMIIRTLAAIDHAHQNGIVHRDIKPQNILVDGEGNVKVADFGIARLMTSQTTRIDDSQNSALGSVHYFSPEQASGEVADEKSDLYSVGVVLYEMLTGRVPFDGETAVSVALKHVNEDPVSMRQIVPGISKALNEVVMRALAKEGDMRYQSAAEMAADLRQALVKPRGGFVQYPESKAEQEIKREIMRRRLMRQRKRLKTMTRIATGAVVGLVIIALAWYFVRVYDTHKMPQLVGVTEQDAVVFLDEAKLLATYEYHYSEDYPKGQVFWQSVSAGSRKKTGSNVLVFVSSGSQWAYLDDLRGMTSEEACQRLTAMEMRPEGVSVEYVLDETLEPGRVVAQSIESGWIQRDSVLILQVTTRSASVPTLIGLSLEGAQALLEANGLKLGTVSEGYSADAAAGTVIVQSAAPGASVMEGEAIDLTVSQPQDAYYYPAVDYTVTVPLEGLTVRLEIIAPSGQHYDGYTSIMNAGTYVVELKSEEPGGHIIREYLNDVLMGETLIDFA